MATAAPYVSLSVPCTQAAVDSECCWLPPLVLVCSPHCLAAGGPGRVSNTSLLTWPVGINGFCGDMYYKDSTPLEVDTNRDHEAGGRFATGGAALHWLRGMLLPLGLRRPWLEAGSGPSRCWYGTSAVQLLLVSWLWSRSCICSKHLA